MFKSFFYTVLFLMITTFSVVDSRTIDRLSVICENSAASELEQSSTFQMCSVFDTAMKIHFLLFDTGIILNSHYFF